MTGYFLQPIYFAKSIIKHQHKTHKTTTIQPTLDLYFGAIHFAIKNSIIHGIKIQTKTNNISLNIVL